MREKHKSEIFTNEKTLISNGKDNNKHFHYKMVKARGKVGYWLEQFEYKNKIFHKR